MDAKANTTSVETDAVKRLLFKIVLSPTLVGEAREKEKGRLSQEFWDAHVQFQKGMVIITKPSFGLMLLQMIVSHTNGIYDTPDMHLLFVSLCALACHVLSKVSGIGSAERNWKKIGRGRPS